MVGNRSSGPSISSESSTSGLEAIEAGAGKAVGEYMFSCVASASESLRVNKSTKTLETGKKVSRKWIRFVGDIEGGDQSLVGPFTLLRPFKNSFSSAKPGTWHSLWHGMHLRMSLSLSLTVASSSSSVNSVSLILSNVLSWTRSTDYSVASLDFLITD